MDYLIAKNISKTYFLNKVENKVLRDINLSVKEGELVAVVGLTGSGKTTLLSLLANLSKPTSGEILLQGTSIDNSNISEGIVFQNYSLLPHMNILENILLPLDEKFKKHNKKQREERALKFIKKVGLADAIYKKPHELSGGMKQRVALARTLAIDPEILLMDEPLSALDALTRSELQDEILSIWKESKKTALLITNNVDEAIIMGDRVIPLVGGPEATLGNSFNVTIKKPDGFKKELQNNIEFYRLKKTITEYIKSHNTKKLS